MAYTTNSDRRTRQSPKNKKRSQKTKISRPPQLAAGGLFLFTATIMLMETKQLSDLHANPNNPNIMKKHEAKALKESIKIFGDLSGIVNNIRTDQMVGGHHRITTLEGMGGHKQVVITQRFDVPNGVGTVAVGYVIYNNEYYAYREVDWPIEKEMAANIAANRIHGDSQKDLLAQANYQIYQAENGAELLKQTGQTDKEIEKALQSVGALPDDPAVSNAKPESMKFAITPGQRKIIEQAIEHIKGNVDLAGIETASLNGTALYSLCKVYLEKQPKPVTGELTDLPIDSTL